jgi:hypothetical protein
MQYALIDVSAGQSRIIDAHEYKSLTTHGDDIKDMEEDEDSMSYKIVYGSYKTQPEHRGDALTIALHMEECKGYGLGHVTGDVCRSIELCDLVIYPPFERRSLDLPFAALIRTHVDLQVGTTQAITAFLRYAQQMTPGTNILNRNGLFAMKSQERRLPKGVSVSPENWLQFVDKDRALRAAQKAI